jgi:sortase B
MWGVSMNNDNKTKLTWVGVLRLVVGGIFRLISIVALLAVLGISYLLFQNAKQTKETQDLNVQLVEMRQEAETEEDNTDWSKGMLDINSNYKGWLTIYGTQISEPVVQGETNETYLRTNINGEHAEAGTLFLDETTDLSQDGNLIIYGHKMNDGTMFGTLDKFEDEEFFDNNGTVCWESEKGKEYYQIFALLVLPGYSTAPDFIDLQAWNNVLDEEQTADMLNTIADRASIFRGESFNLEKDKYLFLVTCDYSINNGRLVLVGRRLSKKSETEKTTEESTDSSEEAVSEEENSENIE